MRTSTMLLRLLLLSLAVLALAACGDGKAPSQASDVGADMADADATTPDSGQDGSSPDAAPPAVPAFCEDGLAGRVQAARAVTDAHGISEYAYSIDEDDARLKLDGLDASGDAVATLAIRQQRDRRGAPLPDRISMEWAPANGSDPIDVAFSFRPLAPERRVEQTTRFSRGGEAFEVVVRYSNVVEAASVRVVRPAGTQAPTTGAATTTLRGDALFTLDLHDGTDFVTADAYDAWAAEAGIPAWSEGPELAALNSVLADRVWIEHSLDLVSACRGLVGLDTFAIPNALTVNEECSLWDVMWTGGGLGAVLAVAGLAVAVVTGAPALAVGAAIVGAAAAIVGTVWFIAQKNCTDVACLAGCSEAGLGGGTCTGALTCSCDEQPESYAGGDPHVRSFDRVYYNVQASGEFVVAAAVDGAPFVIQTRMEPRLTAKCPHVSLHTAFAMRVGDARVGFYADEARPSPLWIDGVPIDLAGYLDLPGGGSIEHFARDRSWVVRFPGGERLEVKMRGGHLNADLDLPPTRRGQLRGLWGTFDANPDNEISRRDGTLLLEPVSFDEFYGDFVESWRLDPAESLFDYESGEDTTTFTIGGFPARPPAIPPADRQPAEAECLARGVTEPALLEACTLDVFCGGPDFADFFVDLEIDKALVREDPLFLDDWTQQGNLGQGNWEVAADGRSVLQRSNGNATFYVSPNDYIETTVRGTLNTSNADNDIMGFVFGYRGPFVENGDLDDAYDMFVLSWKQSVQNPSPEGLTLAHATGPVVDNPLFDQIEEPNYRILATDWGAGTGWERNVIHEFELTYTRQRIEILLDGEPRISITAADAGLVEFPAGRFGFFNFSQPAVTYANFSATAVPSARSDLRLNPTRTYLRTNNDAALDARPLDLAIRGFAPGDAIELQRVGEYSVDRYGLAGMFSATAELLAADQQARVTGALEAGLDVTTTPTADGALPTDVPQDFEISPETMAAGPVRLTIPAGAEFLWLTPIDDSFGDNTDADADFGVSIQAP